MPSFLRWTVTFVLVALIFCVVFAIAAASGIPFVEAPGHDEFAAGLAAIVATSAGAAMSRWTTSGPPVPAAPAERETTAPTDRQPTVWAAAVAVSAWMVLVGGDLVLASSYAPAPTWHGYLALAVAPFGTLAMVPAVVGASRFARLPAFANRRRLAMAITWVVVAAGLGATIRAAGEYSDWLSLRPDGCVLGSWRITDYGYRRADGKDTPYRYHYAAGGAPVVMEFHGDGTAQIFGPDGWAGYQGSYQTGDGVTHPAPPLRSDRYEDGYPTNDRYVFTTRTNQIVTAQQAGDLGPTDWGRQENHQYVCRGDDLVLGDPASADGFRLTRIRP